MKKVVLIDNDTSYVLPLKSEFEKADYEVIYFDDSQKAREALQHLVPDIILCEVELPQINGHALFKEVRSLAATKSVPFIFLSGQKRVDDRIKSMELGVDDYIVKPCSIEEIMARVRALLREISETNEHQSQPEKGFSGNLTEMNLVDLIQTLELGKKSAVLKLKHNTSTGLVFLKHGEVIDATLDNLPPDQALLRMFTWTVGTFVVEMSAIE
ncbi:MAG: response regulator, partial [candidate division KSB1 bacterium]|nr:response regulator [candidate division KSB1 bacterium]